MVLHPLCGCFVLADVSRKYIPRLSVHAHTTILSSTSRTTLTQTYANPFSDKPLDEVRYLFPIHDGVSVVSFTCTVGSRVIQGVVKERQQAKQEFHDAKQRGETAGLLEQSLQAADVFTTLIGNVPAGGHVKVDITYLGELKHDAEIDGLRFTIPTQVVPRYGQAESLLGAGQTKEDGITIVVDAEMPHDSVIKSVQSPSHLISVTLGTTSSTLKNREHSPHRASVEMSQRTTPVNNDFVLQIQATNLSEPSAFLETHSTIPNQRCIMTTLVPRFKLPAEKPEIVFLCDRSGSMHGSIPDLVAALNIFLKSLPIGVSFNLCSFGSTHDFLWPKSRGYSQESLDEAVRYVNNFDADYGGTEMFEPLKDTFERRHKDLNLEVFLLTDGSIWDQDQLFDLVNENVAKSKGSIRIFTLGIGHDVSTSLIEGVARAGRGFSQAVGHDEKMDKKVIRMLRGSLSPHITDLSLEVRYDKTETSTDDDFELIEKVMDGLDIGSPTKQPEEQGPKDTAKPISLFDRSVGDDDLEMKDVSESAGSKFDTLPAIAEPRYLQTPTELPPLFPFNRTTVYIILSDSTPSQQPKSVLLKGNSSHGPLELEIPITVLDEKATTIHQLAARKEMKELEEGRGWVSFVQEEGKPIKEKYASRFEDIVERESVRLGVRYHVGGKWCSFVAIERGLDPSSKDMEQNLGEFTLPKPAYDPNPFASANRSRGIPGARVMLCAAAPAATLSFSGGPMFERARKGDTRAAYTGPDASDDDTECEGFGLMDGGGGPLTEAMFHPETPLQVLTSLQTFVGSWVWSADLAATLGVSAEDASKVKLPNAVAQDKVSSDVLATLCAVAYLKKKLAEDKEAWEMMVEKAETWVVEQVGGSLEELQVAFEGLF